MLINEPESNITVVGLFLINENVLRSDKNRSVYLFILRCKYCTGRSKRVPVGNLFDLFVFRQGWASAMGAIRPPYVKVVCPTAPTMPVTLNAGFRMPSWFDLFSLDASGPEDEEGMTC